MTVAYSPIANFEIKTWDVEFRRAPKRVLMARVYQPQGDGPFPVLLDLHGGAWNNKDRSANEMMDANVAQSGVLVVAIDLTRAGEAPYPALGAGRQLRRALAEVQSARMERRPRQPSACSAARAAATKSNCAPCGRTIAYYTVHQTGRSAGARCNA